MRHFRLLSLPALALLGLAACGEDPVPGPADTGSLELNFDGTSTMVGTWTALALYARGPDAQPVPGVTVRFTVLSGGVVLAADSAVTDLDGFAVVGATMPGEPGPSVVLVTAEGFAPRTGTVHAVPGPPITFGAASLRLVLGCSRSINASLPGHPGFPRATYSISDSSVVRLDEMPGPGSTINRRWVVPLRPGTAEVVVSYAARADTLPVQVVAEADAVPVRLDFYTDSVFLQVGGSESVYTQLSEQGGCGLAHTPAYTSLDPDVVSIYPQGEIVSHRQGRGRVVATYGPFADTVPVSAMLARAFPADTTIRVGERFRYRLELSDTPGVWRETQDVDIGTRTDRIIVRPTQPGWVEGAAPGTDSVMVYWDRQWTIVARVKLTIVP